MSAPIRTMWFKGPIQSVGRAAAAFTRLEVILAAISIITFPLAVLLPFFTLSPSFGDVMADYFYELVNPGALDPTTYSVLGGITVLFADGDVVVAVVLLLFSVFFPAVKLALLWGVLIRPRYAKLSLLRGLERLGPWSMADVFVVAVLLLAFKSFPGGTKFTIRIGYYTFLVSVVTSLVATGLAKYRLKRKPRTTTKEAIPTQEPVLPQIQPPTSASSPTTAFGPWFPVPHCSRFSRPRPSLVP